MAKWAIVGATLLPNVGGWVGALYTNSQVRSKDGSKPWYDTLKKPSYNPPNWLFGPAWTALYSSMGYASYMVYRDCGGFTEKSTLPLALYGAHLVINWTWSSVFFKYHKLGAALVHIVVLDVAATAVTATFYEVNPSTSYFLAPYLGWLSFATLLNYKLWTLNSNEKNDK